MVYQRQGLGVTGAVLFPGIWRKRITFQNNKGSGDFYCENRQLEKDVLMEVELKCEREQAKYIFTA